MEIKDSDVHPTRGAPLGVLRAPSFYSIIGLSLMSATPVFTMEGHGGRAGRIPLAASRTADGQPTGPELTAPALTPRRSPQEIESLVLQLNDDNPRIRTEATRTLSLTPEAEERLIKQAGDPVEPEMQWRATEALKRMHLRRLIEHRSLFSRDYFDDVTARLANPYRPGAVLEALPEVRQIVAQADLYQRLPSDLERSGIRRSSSLGQFISSEYRRLLYTMDWTKLDRLKKTIETYRDAALSLELPARSAPPAESEARRLHVFKRIQLASGLFTALGEASAAAAFFSADLPRWKREWLEALESRDGALIAAGAEKFGRLHVIATALELAQEKGVLTQKAKYFRELAQAVDQNDHQKISHLAAKLPVIFSPATGHRLQRMLAQEPRLP